MFYFKLIGTIGHNHEKIYIRVFTILFVINTNLLILSMTDYHLSH